MLDNSLIVKDQIMPAFTVAQAVERYNAMVEFVKTIMKKDIDYGVIPGTDKPTLYKPGAEKLNTFFGLSARSVLVDSIEDWERGFFYYRYATEIYRGAVLIARTEGSANSKEKKYRWRYIPEFKASDAEKRAAVRKDVRKGKNGSEYTMLVLENDDPYTLVNTIQKIAQKRSYVGSTLPATNASEFFSQDMEDLYIETDYDVVKDDDSATRSARTPTNAQSRAETTTSTSNSTRAAPPLSPVQRNKITELWIALHGDTADQQDAINKLFVESFKHGIAEASYEEGARVTAQLLAELRNRPSPAPATVTTKPAARPLSPDTLRDVLKRKVEKNHVTTAPDKLERQRGLLAGTLQDLCDKNTAKRHELIAALWNVKSLNDLSAAQVSATLDWLALAQDEQSGQWQFKDEQHEKWIRAEIENVLQEALVAQGQKTLPEPASTQEPVRDVTWEELGGSTTVPTPLNIPTLPPKLAIPSTQERAAAVTQSPQSAPAANGYVHLSSSKMTRAQKTLLLEIFMRETFDDKTLALENLDAAFRAKFNKSQYEATLVEADQLLEELQAQEQSAA